MATAAALVIPEKGVGPTRVVGFSAAFMIALWCASNTFMESPWKTFL
jgi:hypothetical protein